MTSLSPSIPFERGEADPLAAVRVWLWVVAALIFAMVLVGGATRLTESGLSITEWKPISGVLPPTSHAAWLDEFDKYKRIPQFASLFPSMTLAGFQTLYYWEWGHRLLGRLIGLVFAVPLAWFWVAGRLTPWLKPRLLGVLMMGALQGVVGWWMVASGLVGRIEVAPERLAIHLLLASLTLVAVVWLAVRLRLRPAPESPPLRLSAGASWMLGLILAQIGLGALVAGSRAGLTYNTWPLMDGRFVPPVGHLVLMNPWWKNGFENVTLVQFDHRMLAYTIVVAALWHAVVARARAPATRAAARATAVAGLVVVQAGLGIATLLLVVPIWAGLLHQFVAMMTLTMATAHRARLVVADAPRLVAPV